MEWINQLNEAMNYIEGHLEDEINYAEIGKIVACPAGAFQRTFSLMTGFTISEYIRKRRMTMAAFELQSTDCKIIDLAMKYGYESSDAFCVAFKKMHGVAPITARQHNTKLKSFSRLSFSLTIKGDVEMNYRIVERENFLVTGKIITSSLENNITPEFWNECKMNGTVDRLVEIGVNPCTLGVCFGYNDEGFNDYMVGIETVSDKYVGLKTVIIPKTKWLVFESVGPVNPTLGETWTRIYSEFMPQSIYKQAELPTIEKYFGNDTTSDTYYVEIWIPIITEG